MGPLRTESWPMLASIEFLFRDWVGTPVTVPEAAKVAAVADLGAVRSPARRCALAVVRGVGAAGSTGDLSASNDRGATP